MNGGVVHLRRRATQSRIARRIEHGYLDVAGRRPRRRAAPGRAAARRAAEPLSIGLLGNAADVVPELLRRGAPIDIVTDQTSAHDPLTYLPERRRASRTWPRCAAEDPAGFTDRARESMAAHVAAMVGFHGRRGRGLRLRQLDPRRGRSWRLRAGLRLPRLRPRLHPAAVLRGQGPVPLGGAVRRPGRHRRHRRGRARRCSRRTRRLARWIRMAQERVALPGPAGPDLLARLRRAGPGRAALQRAGRRRRPAARRSCIGRDHLDCGSVASPYRETEAMADGSDAIADWPLLNALVNTARPARPGCRIHHGGGVGIGRSHPRRPGLRGRRHRAGRRRSSSGC